MFPPQVSNVRSEGSPAQRLSHLACATILVSLISLATTLLTVRLSGVELSVRWSGVGTAVASLGGLYLAWRHLAQSDGDVRLKIV
jgi:hypothetical protein